MNHPYGPTANTAGKKENRLSAARALVVGLVLAFSGEAAWATINPVPGVDIVVRKNPGGIPVSATTDSGGTYKFIGLAPGEYELFVGDQRVQTITVGANRTITGLVNREPNGTARITIDNGSFSGNVLLGIIVKGEEQQPPARVTDLVKGTAERSIVAAGNPTDETSRSNIKRPGIVAESESPPPDGPAGIIYDSAVAKVQEKMQNIATPKLLDVAVAPKSVDAKSPDQAARSVSEITVTREQDVAQKLNTGGFGSGNTLGGFARGGGPGAMAPPMNPGVGMGFGAGGPSGPMTGAGRH